MKGVINMLIKINFHFIKFYSSHQQNTFVLRDAHNEINIAEGRSA